MDTKNVTPLQARRIFRDNALICSTSGMCPGYVQCNLVILPKIYADLFKAFCDKNTFSCPVLEITEVGSTKLKYLANDVDISSDFPLYRIYENGILTKEIPDVKSLWRDDFVGFLIGCSFSFEESLVQNGISIRHNEMKCNVPMYITNIDCTPVEPFHGKMVTSMRPVKNSLLQSAIDLTAKMPRVHGAPIHIGTGEAIGVKNIDKPDFGDPVPIYENETPVFWPCGVTPQSVLISAKLPFAITHAPGHMLICDIKNETLTQFV